MLNSNFNRKVKVHLPKVSFYKTEKHFSLIQLLAFVLVFGAIGIYFLWHSFAAAPTVTKLLTIMEENHSCAAAQAGMPNLSSVAATTNGGQVACANSKGITHPSLPNYLAYATGSTQGVKDDGPPSSHKISGQSVFDQAIAAAEAATSYHESIPSNCKQTDSGSYTAHHNPWAYMSDAVPRANCNAHDISSGSTSSGNLRTDVNGGSLPIVGFLVPTNAHNAHDGTLAAADSWLKAWLAVIETGPDFTSGALAIVVTFDEPDFSAPGTDPVWTVVIRKGMASQTINSGSYNLYSLLRSQERVAGVPFLGKAGSASDLLAAFGL